MNFAIGGGKCFEGFIVDISWLDALILVDHIIEESFEHLLCWNFLTHLHHFLLEAEQVFAELMHIVVGVKVSPLKSV